MINIQKHILLSEINEQVIALDTIKNEYYVINEMGKIFIEKLREHKTLEEISGEIATNYGVAIDRVEADLMEFIQFLSLEGFIEN